MNTSSNIEAFANGQFDWTDGKRAKSLDSIHVAVLQKIDDAIRWYQAKRGSKRKLAWCFRVIAILGAACATAVPTISEMRGRADDWFIHPSLATILGIAVGTLLMLDKFIGASSAWIRYTVAETSLKELRDELSLTYPLESSDWGATGPTIDQTKHTLSTLQSFLARANQIVHDETLQWKTEFQSALQQIDDSAKTAPRKVEVVVATVKITNPDRLADSWKLSVDGAEDDIVVGDSKAIRRTPGPVTVRVATKIKTGTNNGSRDYTTETADVLSSGAPKTIPITLPLN